MNATSRIEASVVGGSDNRVDSCRRAQTRGPTPLVWSLISFCVLTNAVATSVFATVASTEDQILCSSNHFVVARVLKATGHDCGKDVVNFDDCSMAGQVTVEIEVRRVLAQEPPHISPGERTSLSIFLVNGFLFEKRPIQDFDGHLAVLPPTAKLLTKEQINKTLVGSTFIFAYTANSGGTEPPSSSIYRLKQESWVTGHLNKFDRVCVPYPSTMKAYRKPAK